MPTAHRIKRGLAIVPENRRLFGPMTVLENLEMGAYLRPKADLKEEFERVYTLFPLLYERRAQLAGTLSGGEQQMVAMGRALMSQPKLLLMDEPSMGLAPVLVERSFEIIQQVHESGVAMLVVEQNANVSLSIADRGYVLSTGRVVLEGNAAELLRTRTCARRTSAADGSRQLSGQIPPQRGSELALETLQLEPGASLKRATKATTCCCSRSPVPARSPARHCPSGSAALLLEGEQAELSAGSRRARSGTRDDRGRRRPHAPMGARERIVSIDHVEPGKATGSRSFQVLFGPHNGSTRATMFAGYIPPGARPWHYHLYDEIVWVWRGPGRYHLGDAVEELPDGAAFRITPREVHIVENLSDDRRDGRSRHLHAVRKPVGRLPDGRCRGLVRDRHDGVGAAAPRRVPDLRAHDVSQLVLAGGALASRAGGLRGVPGGLGCERRRVGVLGRARRNRARRRSLGCCTASPTRSPSPRPSRRV